MSGVRFVRGDRLLLLVLLIAFCSKASYAQQCIEGQADGFKVRSVRFSSLFGRTSDDLQRKLDAHQGEPYSPDKPGAYIAEIDGFLKSDAAQQKYQNLVADESKLSVRGVFTELDCVERIPPQECQKAMPGISQCVDVSIKRYSVELNALNSSPFWLLFPQSAATVFYNAIPRPLLALNPALNANVDRQFGPAIGLDTATNLLNLRSLSSKVAANPSAANGPPAGNSSAPAEPRAGGDSLEIVSILRPAESGAEDAADTPGASDTSLLLRLSGRKSLNKAFYSTNSRIVLQQRKPPLNVYQGFALDVGFEAAHVPLGDGHSLSNALRLGFSNTLRPKAGPVKLLNLAAAYRRSSDRFDDGNRSTHQAGIENAFEGRVIADGSLGKGLTRGAFWVDHGALDGGRGSYERIASLFGYGKELVIHRRREFHKIRPPELGGRECWTSYRDDPKTNEPAVGMELIAGAGRAWGDVPAHAAFWGGNRPGQFLYDELGAQSLTNFPSGPLLRSFGENQAGVRTGPESSRGGTSYWHSNLNVSIPIPAWSRPLIPHEWVTASRAGEGDDAFEGFIPEGADICRDLKHTLKTLVGKSGVNLLINQQARDRLTDAQKNDLRLRNKENRTAEEDMRLEAAEAVFASSKVETKPVVEDLFRREILPITDFIADQANMIAVKPLLLFDVAHLGLSGFDTPARYGVGGGLQVDVVSARFEFAYFAALNRGQGDPRGNFVGRLVLRSFF